MCSSHIRRTDVLKHSWVDCSRIAEKCGGPKVSRQFQFYSPAISICSRQFQFTHHDFNLLTATISIYLRQFQFTRGNFNFAHGNFNLSLGYDTGVWMTDELMCPCEGQLGSEYSPKML